MNKIYYVFVLLQVLFFASCDKEKDPVDLPKTPVLTIEIGDSIQLAKEDIAFFDSSSSILFLKEDLKIKVGEGIPPQSCTVFRIFADADTLMQGIFYPDEMISLRAYTPNYISSKTYPTLQSKILPVKGPSPTYNVRLMDVLKENDLLRNGITCTVDSIKKIALHDKMVSCKITYTNFDNIAYYVPDPTKMDGAFNSWGQFSLMNNQNQNVIYSTSDFWFSENWNWSLEHLSLLPAKGHITFEYTVYLFEEVTPGDYQCNLQLDNNRHFLPFPIPLDQGASRVWVGSIYAKSSIKIE